MSPALLVLAAVLVCARAALVWDWSCWLVERKRLAASSHQNHENYHCVLTASQHDAASTHNNRSDRALGTELPHGCLYEGQWHTEGATVTTREACLSCVCGRGALSCRRRACAPLPDPPPKRCHVLHRRESCCPELHCPNGVTVMEHGASARFESDHLTDIATPSSIAHACVEDGTVYAAGSALGSRVACEQCFCLRGARHCVRPRCLPPPRACAPRPAPGACCPQRYYCEHATTDPPEQNHRHDCKVDGKWVQEGEQVNPSNGSCTACFCLRGAVRCQELACAPPLLGCTPLLRTGECCAHQYKCHHNQHVQFISKFSPLSNNVLTSMKNDDRSFHSSKSSRLESSTKKIQTSIFILKNTPIASATKNHLVTTTKVKRKTNDPPPETPSLIGGNVTKTATTEGVKPNVANLVAEETTTEIVTERITEQPDGTVKIVINGTINCTAELSSTSLPLNTSVNDKERMKMEVLPRVPIINTEIEAQTYSPNDIITDRNIFGGFDENETFTINVTSSLRTNTSHTSVRPVATTSKIPLKIGLADALNISEKTKGDYDYDYTEPTLPPSLPNLKIIPFVAADAVVDDEKSEGTLTYPVLEREDKFPVYYPNVEKEPAYATRREDVYRPTQYPVFVSDKHSLYPALTHDVDFTSKHHSDLESVVEYAVSTSLSGHGSDAKAITKVPMPSSTFELDAPALNLFSPPVETEGGFIPKSPDVIDDYYAIYPSTPASAALTHLTTSMQLDIAKGECMSAEGHRVPEGGILSVPCGTCRCARGRLRCEARACCLDNACPDDQTTTTSTPTNVHLNKTNINTVNKTDAVFKIPTNHVTATEIITTEKFTNENTTTKPATIETATVVPLSIEKGTTVPVFNQVMNDTSSQEYDDDDDEGFSFGSVLKLLLSDNYETTTIATNKKPTIKPSTKVSSVATVLPTRRLSTVAPFIPLPPRPYIPPKKSPTTVNRIDHLVLGEATAIKKTTMRPITTTRLVQMTTRQIVEEVHSVTSEGPRPANSALSGGVGPGLLKLAGCNIYGRMYRVGRIIAELSTPCQECWCTELGVQCKQLGC